MWGHTLHFFLVLLHLSMSPILAPPFLFVLMMSFKSLSLLPQLHAQIPPVPFHQSRVLIHFGKAQIHVQHHFSCCPTVATTHLPQQHPCSSSEASRFEGDAKSCGVAHKNGLV